MVQKKLPFSKKNIAYIGTNHYCRLYPSFFIAPWLVMFVCGKEYSDAAKILRCMIPLIIIALSTYLFGYPVLGALGDLKTANLSVVIGAVFHIVGLVILYFVGLLSFVAVPFLTFCTDGLVLFIRLFTIKRLLHGGEMVVDIIKKRNENTL